MGLIAKDTASAVCEIAIGGIIMSKPFCRLGTALLALLLLCPSALASAAPQSLLTEADALICAQAFLENPYVNETADRALTVEQTDYGWRVVADADGQHASLLLLLDPTGKVLQYANGAYALPSLAGGAVGWWNVDEEAANDYCFKIDRVSRWLLGNQTPDSIAGVFDTALARDKVYACCCDGGTTYFMLRMEDTPKLYAFGDLREGPVRYGSYLSKDEAEQIAIEALIKEYDLLPVDRELLRLQQATFTLRQGLWTEKQVRLPYWMIYFAVQDGSGSDPTEFYTALVDASTGEVFDTTDPTAGPEG
jgi:hypothetical protein